MAFGIRTCFGGGSVTAPLPSTAAGPSLTTSIHDTRLGPAALTWSGAALGLALRAEINLSAGDDDDDAESVRFRVRPWLLWKRRGSRRFRLSGQPRHRCVTFAWDLSRASFAPGGGGPEPVSGFFVAVVVDGDMLLVAGDLVEEAYKKTRARRQRAPFSNPAPASRREHVVLADPGGCGSYRTLARCGGRDREISIDLGTKESGRESGMSVAVDRKSILRVRRMRWKFRGSEKVEIEGGAHIQVSWDLNDWLFHHKAQNVSGGSTNAEKGRAVFVFRFEEEEEEDTCKLEGHAGDGVYKSMDFRAHSGGNTRNWSESSGNGGRKRRSLLKTSSCSSSTSSMSSASSSTVMEWESHEEMELQRPDGFTLLVYILKS
ncbi:hypothetical protein Cni_G03058 [Canna indica]|uniref:DUF868 family protein n=1 Tax=Canna indica TaxID=4628 RepID=A0AAQ3JQM6_9LILI|nr:hypothetical protein Cni_G03058 [Canna indica]